MLGIVSIVDFGMYVMHKSIVLVMIMDLHSWIGVLDICGSSTQKPNTCQKNLSRMHMNIHVNYRVVSTVTFLENG